MTSIALECSGNTFTLIDNGLPNTFTFQGTNNSDGITITGLGAGTFSIKSINLTEHHPGGAVISYRINNAIDYFPYGKVLREYVGGEKERFLTTQHERDAETGLDYRGARYYDSDVARFLSLDPLAKEFPSWNAYNYVFGNPISLIDPSGRSPEEPENGDEPKKEKEEKKIVVKKELLNLIFGGKDNDKRDNNANRNSLRIKVFWGHKIKDRWDEGTVREQGTLTWGEKVPFDYSVNENEKVKVKGYNQTTVEKSNGEIVQHNKYLGDTYSGGWDGPSQGSANAEGVFFMNPNSDPNLNYQMDYKVTIYRKEEKAGLNWFRIGIIPRTKVSREQRKVDRSLLRSR